MVTNIKGFLLTFSSSRFESCEEVSKTGKVQAAFTCEQVVRVYIINGNAQNAMFLVGFQLFYSAMKTAAITNDSLGSSIMGSSFEKVTSFFQISEPLSRWSLRFSEIY